MSGRPPDRTERLAARALPALRWLGRLGVASAVALVALTLYLRADKRQVFLDTAGEYAGARELERLEPADAVGTADFAALAETAGPADPDGSAGSAESTGPVGAGPSVARHLELLNHRGEAVASIWLRRPERLAAAHRALVVYAGRKTGARILELLPARDDLVVAAVQYPYETPVSWSGRLRWPYDVRRAAFRSVAGGMLAVSHLERAEGIEPARMVIVGSSLGSAFAVAHAALDPRVPRVVVVHGGGDLPRVVRFHQSGRGRPWRGRLYAAAASILVSTFDPLRWVAEVAPRETIVVGARADRAFPAESTQALYDRAREPKRLTWTEGGHVATSPGAELDALLAELDRLLGPPPAPAPAPATEPEV